MRCFIILLLLTNISFAAEGSATKSVTIKKDEKTILEWLKKNPDKLLIESGNEIIKRTNNKVKIARDTGKGRFIFTLEETSTKDTFSTNLIDAQTKELTSQSSDIKVFTKDGKTQIKIEMQATVDRNDIDNFDINFDLEQSVERLAELFKDTFNK